MMGGVLTFQDLSGRVPTEQELKTELVALARHGVVQWLIWLNARTQPPHGPTIEGDKELVRRVFGRYAREIESARARMKSKKGVFVFSRFTTLWLLGQAFRQCPTSAGAFDHCSVEAMGFAYLMANDLAYRFGNLGLTGAVKDLVPGTDYFPRNSGGLDIARTLVLLTEIAPKSARKSVQDLPAVLELHTGHRLEELFELVMGCTISLECNQEPRAFDIPTIIPDRYRLTTLSAERVRSFLTSVSATSEEFTDYFSDQQRLDRDLTIFRRFPFLQDGEHFVCIDPGFLLDKVGAGLFWTLFEATSPSERQAFKGTWGYLFEEYVAEFLSRYISHGNVLANARFADDQEAFDVCILEKDTLIAIECKSSCIRGEAKYKDRLNEFESVLDQRFAYGLAQLNRSISRFGAGDAIRTPDGNDLKWRSSMRLMPLLIHQEMGLKPPLMNAHLAIKSHNSCSLPISVHPMSPVVAHILDLEEVAGYFRKFRLSQILHSYLGALAQDPARVFERSLIPLLSAQPLIQSPAIKRLDEFYEEMMHRVFPDYPGKAALDSQQRPMRHTKRPRRNRR